MEILLLKLWVLDVGDCKPNQLKAHEVMCYHYWMGLIVCDFVHDGLIIIVRYICCECVCLC